MRQLGGPGRRTGSTMPADWLYLLTQYFGLNMESLCKVALKIKWKLVAHLASCTIWLNHKSSVGIVVLTVIVRSPHAGQAILYHLTLVSKLGASLSSINMTEWREDFSISCQGASALTFLYSYGKAVFTSACAVCHCKMKMFFHRACSGWNMSATSIRNLKSTQLIPFIAQ